jgi:hypothetical protein
MWAVVALLHTAAALRLEDPDEVRVLLGDAQHGLSARVGAASDKQQVMYLNATVDGNEYGCLGCQPHLFKEFLAHETGKSPPVKMNHLWYKDYVRKRAVFNQMFEQRRLVLGGVGGLTDVSFVESLSDLARKSPHVYDKDFSAGKGDTSQYNIGVHSGEIELTQEPLLKAMRQVWPKIDDLKYVEGDEEANKKHAHQVLQRVKQKFFFYRAGCLANQCKVEGKPPVPTTMLGIVSCSAEDRAKGLCQYSEARRCESATCGHAWAEFPRYHGLLKLLDVKRGRCSELSRVAYGAYLALGYDARMVIDFTDHVWTEVRLPRGPNGTWYHGDPSEGVFDRPIMYERGWGKKLTFVFGVTPNSVEDVSKKYTADYESMVARRGIDDKTLARVLEKVNHRITYSSPMKPWGFSDTGSVIENVAFSSRFM